MTDSNDKKLSDAPATLQSEVLTHFDFYNTDGTNKISVFMCVIYAFYIL